MKNTSDSYAVLKNYIRRLGPVLVAFSGGADSTLLLEAAADAGISTVHAVTLRGQMIPERESIHAADYCIKRGIGHTIKNIDITASRDFMENTPHRCYHCKKIIFTEILQLSRGMNIPYVIEGSHTTDTYDFRPGIKAIRELGIISPFIETGMTKTDIMDISRTMGIEGWDEPSGSCLATRVPYGTPVTVDLLSMINTAEEFLRGEGFRQGSMNIHITERDN